MRPHAIIIIICWREKKKPRPKKHFSSSLGHSDRHSGDEAVARNFVGKEDIFEYSFVHLNICSSTVLQRRGGSLNRSQGEKWARVYIFWAMGTFGSEKDVEKTFWAHVPKPNRTISLLLLRLINGPWLCIERRPWIWERMTCGETKKSFLGGEKFVRETGVVCRTGFFSFVWLPGMIKLETLRRRQVSKDYREKNASTTYVDFPDTYFCFDEVGSFPLYFLFPVWQEGGEKQNMQGIQEKGRRKWVWRFRRPEKFEATSQQHRLIMSKKELRSQRQSFPLFLFPWGI